MRQASPAALQRAVTLIQRVCDIAAPRHYLAETREHLEEAGIAKAVANHDTPTLFAWLMDILSYQGISDKIARGYMDRHGRVQWAEIAEGVNRPNACPKLATYWTYHGCGFRKSARTCACPDQLEQCIVSSLPTRNGSLAQSAVALHLFLRDVCGGDFVGWIDQQLALSPEADTAPIIAALRPIHGVSDKVLSLALVVLLLGGRPHSETWQRAGTRLVVIDTLVHNWLHRNGILDGLIARHTYGAKCYEPNGCADIIQRAAAEIDARRYGSENPENFPRLIQAAIWRFCAADAFDICNGNRIDDRRPCDGLGCPVSDGCGRTALHAKPSAL